MSTTTTTTLPAGPDAGYFSKSKHSATITARAPSVSVTTRPIPIPTTLDPTRFTPHRFVSGVPSAYSRAPSVSSRGSSPLSSPSPGKRKSTPPTSDAPLPREVKRLRASGSGNGERPRRRTPGTSSKRGSRAASPEHAPSPPPEPIYRSSRSRSTSQFPGQEIDTEIEHRDWTNPKDGYPGEGFVSSEVVVKGLMKSYKAYFENPLDPNDTKYQPHPTNYPVCELEYPNTGASERFILLAPKDKDHYNPILDLMQTLYTIAEFYLTPHQLSLLGTLPNDSEHEAETPPSSPNPSRSPTPELTRSSSSSDETSFPQTVPPSPLFTPQILENEDEVDIFKATADISQKKIESDRPAQVPLLRALQRAFNTQDGPLFTRTMTQINRLLRNFKYPDLPNDILQPRHPNALKERVKTWEKTGLPKQVLMRIIEENYQRNVGPHIPKLKNYEAFSSTVYGELMPSLAYEMMLVGKLKQGSLFLDLGSGVGNVCVQASLQTGCRSYGIEIQKAPAEVAKDMEKQLLTRCRMWGVRVGDVELEKGDMLASSRVDELIPKADVVLVDNKVFEESLNEALRPKFLDLKEGAMVISLKPFVSSLNARITERNLNDMSAIFEVSERPYHSGSVSWGANGGVYYVHKVNRQSYADIRERFENSWSTNTRSSRRR